MTKDKKTFKKEKKGSQALASQHYNDWLRSQFEDETRIVFKCNICEQDVEVYHEDTNLNIDISEELESHLTSAHDSNEWINYEGGRDNTLPYFDHKGKQITSNEYHSRYYNYWNDRT